MSSPLHYWRRVALVLTVLIVVVWVSTFEAIVSRMPNKAMATIVYTNKKF